VILLVFMHPSVVVQLIVLGKVIREISEVDVQIPPVKIEGDAEVSPLIY
jgi:hypothetical protein